MLAAPDLARASSSSTITGTSKKAELSGATDSPDEVVPDSGTMVVASGSAMSSHMAHGVSHTQQTHTAHTHKKKHVHAPPSKSSLSLIRLRLLHIRNRRNRDLLLSHLQLAANDIPSDCSESAALGEEVYYIVDQEDVQIAWHPRKKQQDQVHHVAVLTCILKHTSTQPHARARARAHTYTLEK